MRDLLMALSAVGIVGLHLNAVASEGPKDPIEPTIPYEQEEPPESSEVPYHDEDEAPEDDEGLSDKQCGDQLNHKKS